MKKIVIFFLGVFLFSANLINVNFFQQKNKLDILFSLDNKFKGKVVEINKNKFLIENVSSNNEYYKNFDHFFIKKVKIVPDKKGVLIYLDIKSPYKTSVALTPDGYGIRFRIIDDIKTIEMINTSTQKNYNKLDFLSYLVALLVLIIISVILLVFKKKAHSVSKNEEVSILFQKYIDPKNKIILMEFNKRKYLLVVGNSNILLDIFDENMVNISNKEFDKYLKEEVSDRLDYLKEYIEHAEKLKELDEKV